MQNPFRPHNRRRHEPDRAPASGHGEAPANTARHDAWENDSARDHRSGGKRGAASLAPPPLGGWGPTTGQVARGSELNGGPATGFGGGMQGQSDYGVPPGGARTRHQGAAATYASGAAQDEPEFEPDYLHWREQQIRSLDDDYRRWRAERRDRFASDFSTWRSARDEAARRNNLSASGVQDVADGGPGRSDRAGPPES